MKKLFLSTILAIAIIGCATYYEKSNEFQTSYVKSDFAAANQTLDKIKKGETNINRLLFFFQKGTVLANLGQLQESNNFFEKAYIYTEDHKKKFSREAVSILTNPSVKEYAPEDHETVLLNYFKAVNFLRMNQIDEAMVEIRRVNNRLNQLNDRYEKKKNRYTSDAFAHNLMGICYEKNGDINDAFIAYKNSYNVYQDSYSTNFGVKAPQQLKKDLVRLAALNGFAEEQEKYENLFNLKADLTKPDSELILFWQNGLGPVKAEWSVNFAVVKGQGGVVVFKNDELGLSFPFPVPSSGNGSGGLGDLKFIRIAFPKYLDRKPYFQTAAVIVNNKRFTVEMAENINNIAFKTLEDRMQRELANGLMRLALKQAAEYELRKQSQNLGALLSVLNAVSEKADTRNWQTLPYSISYARVPLIEGDNKVELLLDSNLKLGVKKESMEFSVSKGQTIFHVYQNLESQPLSY